MTKTMNFQNVNVTVAVMMFVMMLLGSTSAKAESQLDAKVYMTYADFVAGKSVSIDSLVDGSTHQICQIRQEDYQFRINTGDKKVNKLLKTKALIVEYGGQLYVNCRNLRRNGNPLEVYNYTQAFRYDGNKLCVVSHKTNDVALLADIAATATVIASPIEVALPAAVAGTVISMNMDRLSSYRCFCLDTDADEKGITPVVRMDDPYMYNVLKDSPELLERYKSLSNKRQRQSAANILPFLKEKGLI